MKKLIAPLLAATLLVACSPADEPSTSPSGAPSSAMPSSTPTPSDPAQDPLYLEAVGVYKAFFKELQKEEAAGYPSAEWPIAMDLYVTGRMKDMTRQMIEMGHEDEIRPAPGQLAVLSKIAPNPGVSRDSSVVSIRLCADARRVKVVNKDDGEPVGTGTLVYKEVFFKQFDGRLKAFTQTAKEATECPIEP